MGEYSCVYNLKKTERNVRKTFLCLLFALLEALSSHFVKLSTLLERKRKHNKLSSRSYKECVDIYVLKLLLRFLSVSELINQAAVLFWCLLPPSGSSAALRP